MIEGMIGRPGSGKSYLMTRKVLSEADRGRACFVNWGIAHPNVFYFEPSQLLDLPPGHVFIDEAHLWFPARMALKLPMSWLAGMSQTRKAGWDLTWAAQHETRVDRMVRDVTGWMHKCTAWFSHNDHPVIFRTTTWEPEFFRRPKMQMGSSTAFFSRRVADAYNTHESLTQAEHTKDQKDVYEKARSKRGGSVLEEVLG